MWYESASPILILFVQVEETTREREERLKGWSTFLEVGNQGQQNNTAKPAEDGTTPTPTTTTTEPTEPSSTTEPKQQPETEPQRQEQEADSTDSSLAGSDDEEA